MSCAASGCLWLLGLTVAAGLAGCGPDGGEATGPATSDLAVREAAVPDRSSVDPTSPGVPHADDWSWGSYASSAGSSKYAPLDQIDAGNFSQLEVAWTWTPPDVIWKKKFTEARKEGKAKRIKITDSFSVIDFQGTPLVVDGVMYGVTAMGMVYALDAATGRQLWAHDPRSYRFARNYYDFIFPKHRGVTYWRGSREGDEARILIPTIDAWLLALDARTGEPVESFGEAGRVDLMEGLRGPMPRRLGEYFQTSPAALVGDTIVVGGTVHDRPKSMRSTPGDIRGYDVRTGRQKWVFHVVPAEGELGTDTWGDESWRYSGAANVWGPMSVDAELGYVYVETSTPTNDHYGGHRPGANLFGESLLCLDGETGKRIWHYQIIHHGLWDYDLSAPPNLIDIEVEGRRIEAVALVTKMGFAYVFDRRTGKPVWPIEERPVPPSDIPGEVAHPTQPIPTRPPPYERVGTTSEDELIDFTPELRERALRYVRAQRTGPLYTPPSLGAGTLTMPGPSGGTNWYGAGVDPETGILYVPSITRPSLVSVKPSDDTDMRYVGANAIPVWLPPYDGAPQPEQLPLWKPPYSRITAIDLNLGEIAWQVANGEGPRDHPSLAHLDLPRLGSGAATCVVVTKSLVIAHDGAEIFIPWLGKPLLWAYDKATGEVVGRVDLTAKARGCPMTYQLGGRQYIAIPSAPDGGDPILVVLALPESRPS